MAILYNNPTGKLRLLISDIDEDNLILSDAQIEGFLDIESSLKRAAAAALDAIATSETLISKKIRTQDLATDGPAVAAELRARAKTLREEDDEEDGEGGAGFFDIVDYDPYRTRSRYELAEE